MEAKVFARASYHKSPFDPRLFNAVAWSDNVNYISVILTTLGLGALGLVGSIALFKLGRRIYYRFTCPTADNIYNRDNCPICLNEFVIPIRTDCGHAFCIKCLLTYFTKNPADENCPMCRNHVNNFQCLHAGDI